MNELRLAWLAGIIDGEGCISFYMDESRYIRKDGVRNSSIRFCVHVANTDERIINEVASIAKAHNIPYQILFVKSSLTGKNKMRIDIKFAGAKRTEAVLRLVLPYLVGKRDRAELALSVIEHRQNTRSRKQVEVKDDQWLSSQLGKWRELNHRGIANA